MSEERFKDALSDLRRSYNDPPETPREEMWAVIRAATTHEGQGSVVPITAGRRRMRWGTWAGLLAAAAVLLVMGVGIGRMSVERGGPGLATAEPEPAAESAAAGRAGTGLEAPDDATRARAPFRFAAVSHLLKSESLLTMVRTDTKAGRYDAAMSGWARELLTETRLLMDSPAAEDPLMAELLQDLELILVQLASMSAESTGSDRSQAELELVNQGIDRHDMLLRIQAVVPAGSGLVGA